MAEGSSHRTVTVERLTQGVFTVTNTRGGQLRFGTGSDSDFTPTEPTRTRSAMPTVTG